MYYIQIEDLAANALITYNDPQFLEGRQPNTMRGKELSWQIKRKWALLH